MYYLFKLGGANNYLLYQLLNCLAITYFYKYLADLSDESNNTRVIGLGIIGVGVLFYPLILFTSFVYGNIIGLTCSIGSVVYINKYKTSGKIRFIVLASVMAFLAIFVKNNYMIFIIGISCYICLLLLGDINKKDFSYIKREIVTLVLLIVIMFSQGIIARELICNISGKDLPKSGVSSWAFIAMGLQENGGRFDGWYNGYNELTYNGDIGYDTSEQAKIAKEDIDGRLEDFKNDFSYTFAFFSGKNASQWNNPSFQSYWINTSMSSDIRFAKWHENIFSLIGIRRGLRYLNYVQFIILAGSLCYLIFKRDKSYVEYLYEIIIIGGFIFHSFWEAKCQYTISYFVLFIPLCVSGYYYLVRDINDKIKTGKIYKSIITFLLVIVVIDAVINYNSVLHNIFINNEDEYYEELIEGGYI